MKKIITYIITLILLISIIAITFIAIAKKTILNKQYVINKMEQYNYYENIAKNIQLGFEEYIQQSGLDEDVIEGLYTQEEIEADVKIMLDNLYENEKKEVDIEKIKSKLREKVYNSLANINLSSTEKESIESFIDLIGDVYKNEIEHTKWLDKLNGNIYNINEKLNKFTICFYLVPLVLIAIIYIINIKQIYVSFKVVGIVALSYGILMLITIIFTKINIDIENILILNEIVSKIVKESMREVLNILTLLSILFSIAGILICFVTNYILTTRRGKERD